MRNRGDDIVRDYRTLCRMQTFEERFEYLKLNGVTCAETFGFDRYLNQKLYQSPEWKRVRDYVIIRDDGNDLGLDGHPIHGKIYIHHMNPVNKEDILSGRKDILNPDYLVCVSQAVHHAIHYGDANLLPKEFVERTPNDECPWRNGV